MAPCRFIRPAFNKLPAKWLSCMDSAFFTINISRGEIVFFILAYKIVEHKPPRLRLYSANSVPFSRVCKPLQTRPLLHVWGISRTFRQRTFFRTPEFLSLFSHRACPVHCSSYRRPPAVRVGSLWRDLF